MKKIFQTFNFKQKFFWETSIQQDYTFYFGDFYDISTLINTLVILFTMTYLLCFINSWLENGAVIMYGLYLYSNTKSSHTFDLPG